MSHVDDNAKRTESARHCEDDGYGIAELVGLVGVVLAEGGYGQEAKVPGAQWLFGHSLFFDVLFLLFVECAVVERGWHLRRGGIF